MNNEGNRILVLGLGNPLMGDDGVGCYVISELQGEDWPDGVVVLDAGTSAITCLDEICRSTFLIAIDAVQAGGQPGSVYRLTVDEGSAGAPGPGDAHGIPLTTVVALARTLTGLPLEVVIIGIEPEHVGPGLDLSDPVRQAVAVATKRIREEVELRSGFPESCRAAPGEEGAD